MACTPQAPAWLSASFGAVKAAKIATVAAAAEAQRHANVQLEARPVTSLGYDIRERRANAKWGLPQSTAPHRREGGAAERPAGKHVKVKQYNYIPRYSRGNLKTANSTYSGNTWADFDRPRTMPAGTEYTPAKSGLAAMHSSGLAAAASKLQAPEEIHKHLQTVYVSDTSTGGNGIRRPYGMFTAHRNGNGKSMYARLPLRKEKEWELNAPPKATDKDREWGQNVSHFNIMRKDSTKRNMKLDRHRIRSKFSYKGYDTVQCKPEAFRQETRPFMDTLGKARDAQQARSRRYTFPSATFLTELPTTVPSDVRVDCGSMTTIEFMFPQLH